MEEDSDIPFTLQGRTGQVAGWDVTTTLALAFGHSALSFHVSIITRLTRYISHDTELI